MPRSSVRARESPQTSGLVPREQEAGTEPPEPVKFSLG